MFLLHLARGVLYSKQAQRVATTSTLRVMSHLPSGASCRIAFPVKAIDGMKRLVYFFVTATT